MPRIEIVESNITVPLLGMRWYVLEQRTVQKFTADRQRGKGDAPCSLAYNDLWFTDPWPPLRENTRSVLLILEHYLNFSIFFNTSYSIEINEAIFWR